MLRHRLTDEQWDLIKDVLPPPKKMGRKPRDPRDVLDGIFWILRTGAPWRDLPEEFGAWRTAWCYFDKWNDDGTLDEILHLLRAAHIDGEEVDDQLWCVDGSSIRAARCAAGGGKKGIPRSLLTTH